MSWFCERLRLAVSGLDVPLVGRVSVSVGLAVVEGDEAIEATVARADALLYEAKRAGRDTIRG